MIHMKMLSLTNVIKIDKKMLMLMLILLMSNMLIRL